MIPFVSREDTEFAIKGRIPAAIQGGSLLERADMPLNAEQSHVMICGNPGMVKDTSEVLMNLGFKKNQRREPGQITTENYW
jgi:ferredoxin--NADP+ reductase